MDASGAELCIVHRALVRAKSGLRDYKLADMGTCNRAYLSATGYFSTSELLTFHSPNDTVDL